MDWLKKWRNWSKIPISTRVLFCVVVILDITLFVLRFSKFREKKKTNPFISFSGLLDHARQFLQSFYNLAQTHKGMKRY